MSYENFAKQFKILLNIVCQLVLTKRCLYLSMTFAQGIRGKKIKRKKDQCFDADKLVLESLSHTNQSIPQSDFLYKKVLAEQQKKRVEWRFVYFYHHTYPQIQLTVELNGEALKEKRKSTIRLEKVYREFFPPIKKNQTQL